MFARALGDEAEQLKEALLDIDVISVPHSDALVPNSLARLLQDGHSFEIASVLVVRVKITSRVTMIKWFTEEISPAKYRRST